MRQRWCIGRRLLVQLRANNQLQARKITLVYFCFTKYSKTPFNLTIEAFHTYYYDMFPQNSFKSKIKGLFRDIFTF